MQRDDGCFEVFLDHFLVTRSLRVGVGALMIPGETGRDELLREIERLRSELDRYLQPDSWQTVLLQHWERVFDMAPVLLAVAGLDGYYRRVNAAFQTVLGHTEQETLAKPFLEFVHPDDREASRLELARLASGEPVIDYEERNVCRDGSFRCISWTMVPVPDHGLVFRFGRDITKRREAIEAIRHNEQKWISVVSNAPVFIAIVDRDGRLTYLNHSYPETPLDQVLGRTVYDYTDPEYADRVRCSLKRVFERGERAVFESVGTGPEGRASWYESYVGPVIVDGQIIAATITAIDITGRKLIEHALREEKQRFQSVYENAPVGIALVEPEGHVIKANQDLCRFLGYTPQELTGLHFGDFTHPDDLDADVHLFRSLMQGGIESYNIEKRYVRKSGDIVWGSLHVGCVKDESGRVRESIVVCDDITHQKQVEDRLHQDNVELERRVQERTSELSATNEQLRREVEERARAETELVAEREGLRRMLEAQERERQLIAYEIHDGLAQQLLAAKMLMDSYTRKKDRESPQAADLLDEGLQLLAKAAREARHLIGGLRPPLLDEAGLAAAIRQIAAEAEEGGLRVDVEVDVRAERLPRITESNIFRMIQESLTNARLHSGSDRVAIRLVETAEKLQVEVRDWGRGFDPDTVPKTCYGLGGIRQRAHLFGGTAAIESVPGEGTRVFVELPREYVERE